MSKTKSINLKSLEAFLKRNSNVDFRKADLLHRNNLQKYKWGRQSQEKVLPQLKAYQRILRIVPEDRPELAQELLKKGFNSSLQITQIPKKSFVAENLEILGGDKQLAEEIYLRAFAVKKAVTLQYLSRVQQNEPHARTAGFIR